MNEDAAQRSYIITCNGADLSKDAKRKFGKNALSLEYRQLPRCKPNVKILLPDFVRGVFYLPDRILDLLEIAACLFAADRLISRGPKDALEYHQWARSLHFVFKVRDYNFWKNTTIKERLSEALCFMSGDKEYDFTFQGGHSTPPTSLFDSEEFKVDQHDKPSLILFSGGIDALVGVIERLEKSQEKICLVSHRSGQPGTVKTQDALYRALSSRYPDRIKHYKFHCSLTGKHANEETQRTRAFLYCSIAYALCHAFGQKSFFVYENGVTAMNFLRRQDLINARASRTTHPKTIALLETVFSEIEESPIKIVTPFFWKTKTEVLLSLKNSGLKELITSSVSCSRTFQNLEQSTHCGGCYQCVDRRFASFAAEMDDIDDSGLYALDFVRNPIEEGEIKTTLVDYVRQGCNYARWNLDHFHDQMLNQLTYLVDFVSCKNEEEAVTNIWNLCRRHGEHIFRAIKRMRIVHDNPFQKIKKGSFLHIISEREYLKEPLQRLIDEISNLLKKSIPIVFQKNRPKDEPDFNDKVSGILNSDKDKFTREHSAISFALAKAIPDHSLEDYELLIESKYIRGSTTPSVASEGLAADLTKYPSSSHILFVVYDPDRCIYDDEKFKDDFENKGRCTILTMLSWFIEGSGTHPLS